MVNNDDLGAVRSWSSGMVDSFQSGPGSYPGQGYSAVALCICKNLPLSTRCIVSFAAVIGVVTQRFSPLTAA